jgi:transcriptional regulator with XRE-family HTH domain
MASNDLTPLRKARHARGLSQQELGRKVGTDSGNISRIEKEDQVPSHKLAERITAFLKDVGLDDERMIFYPERYKHWTPKTAGTGV